MENQHTRQVICRHFQDGQELDVAGLNRITVLVDRSQTALTEAHEGRPLRLGLSTPSQPPQPLPLVVMTGDDGHGYDNMLLLHGEASPLRLRGIHKNLGQQYIRGIEEGNGDPPGEYLWNTYSMNKECLWVTRTRLPIRGAVDEHVAEDFRSAESPADLALWNLHVPQWAPARSRCRFHTPGRTTSIWGSTTANPSTATP